MSFLPSAPVLAAFLAACVVLAVTPGPDMALFLQKTLGGGRPHGFAALGGASAGILMHTLAAALGLSALIAASSQLYGALKIVGALYLLWLAYNALRRGSALKVETGGLVDSSLTRTFLTGLLINLTNPKIILFFVTFLPQFIDAGDPSATSKFLFLGVAFVTVASFLNGLLILVAARFLAAAKAHPRALRVFDYGVATVMGGFAARLLASQSR